jgi:glycosyltransferase involved in cell wall biosynthesis
MRIAFITNFCPFYRVKLFRLLAEQHDIRFHFFSDASEKNWESLNPHGIDEVHVVSLHTPSAGRLKVLIRLVRALWTQPYDIYIQGISGRFAVPLTYLIARLRKKPFILWTGFWNHPSTLFHRLTRPLVKYIYRHADALVVYGTHVRDYLVSLGVDPERIFIAWNTADNDVYNLPVTDAEIAELRERHNLGDQRVLLFVGRLQPEKGVDVLLNAVTRFERQPAILIIGRGPDKAKLESICSKYNLDHVRFLDYIPNNELYRYYRLADAVILPSITTARFKEPWGLVINEAMNQEATVIASDAVGAARGGLIEDGRNGIVVSEGDEDQLFRAIVGILAHDEMRRAIGSAAKETISAWTYPRMAQGFTDAITYVTSTRS